MEAFTRVEGVAAPLIIDNVDTDAIIPSRESQSVSRSGYGEKLFANWRYLRGTRTPDAAFILNRPPYSQATILVSGRNFGCGSSREAAVWALVQFGIRVVIAESFGAIFRNNCIRNGLLPVALPPESLATVHRTVTAGPAAVLIVDLPSQSVMAPDGATQHFQIGALEREMLLQGLDEITLTLVRRGEIERFRGNDRAARPWLYADGTPPLN